MDAYTYKHMISFPVQCKQCILPRGAYPGEDRRKVSEHCPQMGGWFGNNLTTIFSNENQMIVQGIDTMVEGSKACSFLHNEP